MQKFKIKFFHIIIKQSDKSTNLNWEVLRNESKNHFSMQRVQAEKLQHNEEQEERSRQTRDEEVLPFLQKAHNAQGNKISLTNRVYSM